ncbi:MAG TPA: hydratase [Mesorhizobium sp.]|jgi:2-oxo-3-hexenedioate decarboxylase|nr:hydratase [Mesorhizobium sp.]
MVDAIAAEAFSLLGTGRQTASFSPRYPDLDLPLAYKVASAVRGLREARGERVVGRKIGFTNRTIWDEYNVDAPIWGWIYASSVHEANDLTGGFPLSDLSEPRIEPEIVFGLCQTPKPGMDGSDLLGCVGWIAHGFEIVQSIFPGWVFTPADTVAAYGLHAAMLMGPRRTMGEDREEWFEALSTFEIDLLRDGELVDHGVARNVLDGPLHALKHLNDLLARDSSFPPLAAGEMVTTGTLTRALPIAGGQSWSTRLHGVDLSPISVRFC